MPDLSLAAYLANDKDALLRAQYLELAYDNGIRDEESCRIYRCPWHGSTI